MNTVTTLCWIAMLFLLQVFFDALLIVLFLRTVIARPHVRTRDRRTVDASFQFSTEEYRKFHLRQWGRGSSDLHRPFRIDLCDHQVRVLADKSRGHVKSKLFSTRPSNGNDNDTCHELVAISPCNVAHKLFFDSVDGKLLAIEMTMNFTSTTTRLFHDSMIQ
jgi:hypothetical protein